MIRISPRWCAALNKYTVFIVFFVLFTNLSVAGAGFPDDRCLQGVRAAYEAYFVSVTDAHYPDTQKAVFTLGARLSQQPYPVNEADAYRSLTYIIKRLQHTSTGFPQENDIAAAANEYIRKECHR